MATVQLADVYEPLAFDRKMQEAMVESNAFLASGVAVQDSLISQNLSGGSNIIDLAHYSKLSDIEPNYSNDDPASKSTTEKISSVIQKVRAASRNRSFAAMDLATSLTNLEDPLGAVASQIGGVFGTDENQRLSYSVKGIHADNVANDSSDMVHSVANDAAGAITAAEQISHEAIANALQTAGDALTGFGAIAMHSIQYTTLSISKALEPQYDSRDGSFMYSTYNGLRVIVDDNLPKTVGSNRTTYTAVLFGNGSVGLGTGRVKTPSELWRNPSAGNGGGEEELYARVNTAAHPYGFSFLSASVAGQSATRAELATATNWNRVVDRKNVALAFLDTNG